MRLGSSIQNWKTIWMNEEKQRHIPRGCASFGFRRTTKEMGILFVFVLFRSVLFHVSYMPISCKKTTGVQASMYGNLKRGDPMNAKDFFDGLVKARMRDDLRMRVRYKR